MKSTEAGQVWRNPPFYLALIPVLALLIKLILASRITPIIEFSGHLQGGGWLGADGENYFSAAGSLLDNGVFSKDSILAYWPAGYPIFIALLGKISIGHTMWLVSILQSLLFAFACYYFIEQLRRTALAKYCLALALILSLNPTLTLSSLVIGYESSIASLMLLVVALIVKRFNRQEQSPLWRAALPVGALLGVAAFMQPRWILTTVVIAAIWGHFTSPRKSGVLVLALVIATMSIAPGLLILRNIAAGNGAVISTNLGATMAIGAGDETSGSYARKGPEVPCPSESELTRCVIKWYLNNPAKSAKLFINKSVYFWSPWSGVLRDGTMKRNPWHLINPLEKMSASSEQGYLLIQGTLGRVISWIWLLGGIALFFTGFFWLASFGGSATLLAWLCATPVIASWLVAMATIGDHRFRLPTMALSLTLQVVGAYALRKKAVTGTFAPAA